MQKIHHSFTIILTAMLLLSSWWSFAQESKEDLITYAAPNSKFVDINIQSHKGLPRFGDLYFVRGVTPPTNPQAYNQLLKMKYLVDAYADMNKEMLTDYDQSRSGDKKLENSFMTQSQLLLLASKICTENELKKYFCPEKSSKPCTFINTYGQRSNIGHWGGDRGNKFAQIRSYKAFIKENLSDLQNWSTTLFKNDMELAYMVSRTFVADAYDFQHKGYWIKGNVGGQSPLISNIRFAPYGQDQQNMGRVKFLLPITPEKAKSLRFQQRSPIFIVAKVKIYPDKEISSPSNRTPFAYELENTTLEVYKDNALTEKIGEISIENATTKY